MKIAFYAPLKPPDHPTPSGDRSMARALMAALRNGGHQVDLASTMRSRDGSGDVAAQTRLEAAAASEISRISADSDSRHWGCWVTYHNYYKAPDLIGPAVTRALGIPYVLIEATRARKRLQGPWAKLAAASEAACDAAAIIFYLTRRDAETLRRDAPPRQRLVHLPPFLNRTSLPRDSDRSGPMLSVGMMRSGDKLASYRLIADTLALLPGADWRLDIAGDGAARAQVEDMFAPFAPQVRFLGLLDPDAIAALYSRASLLFWPGVNEAFGLAYLEAQAAGLPIVAQDRPGVRDVLAFSHPRPSLGPEPMAARLSRLLADPALRATEGRAGRAMIARDHLLGSATARLNAVLETLT